MVVDRLGLDCCTVAGVDWNRHIDLVDMVMNKMLVDIVRADTESDQFDKDC